MWTIQMLKMQDLEIQDLVASYQKMQDFTCQFYY